MSLSKIKLVHVIIVSFSAVLFGLVFGIFGCLFSKYLGFNMVGIEELSCGISGFFYGKAGIIIGLIVGLLVVYRKYFIKY